MKLYDPPAIKIAVQRLCCIGCGAEANASCNCGKPYVPKSTRAAEAIAANPEKSNRAIAEETGLSEPTVRRARASYDAPELDEHVGRDGKSYPATKPAPSYDDDEPDADPSYDYEPDDAPYWPQERATKTEPLPRPARLSRDPLAEAAGLKSQIIALMRLMRPIEREQFKLALLEDLVAMDRALEAENLQ
jgi:hypothetical protein